MALRTGHGNGAGSPRVEVLPPDELPPATPALTVAPDRDQSGRFAAGNSVAKSKRLRPGLRGLTGAETTSPSYEPFARWGRRYGAHRRRELASVHGGELSAGVGAIVESAALAMAASRYLTHLAGQTGDADLFQRAARLAESARQHELAAWELAAREAQARGPKTTVLDQIEADTQRIAAERIAAERVAGELAAKGDP
jgi:hypothetical protein